MSFNREPYSVAHRFQYHLQQIMNEDKILQTEEKIEKKLEGKFWLNEKQKLIIPPIMYAKNDVLKELEEMKLGKAEFTKQKNKLKDFYSCVEKSLSPDLDFETFKKNVNNKTFFSAFKIYNPKNNVSNSALPEFKENGEGKNVVHFEKMEAHSAKPSYTKYNNIGAGLMVLGMAASLLAIPLLFTVGLPIVLAVALPIGLTLVLLGGAFTMGGLHYENKNRNEDRVVEAEQSDSSIGIAKNPRVYNTGAITEELGQSRTTKNVAKQGSPAFKTEQQIERASTEVVMASKLTEKQNQTPIVNDESASFCRHMSGGRG